MIFPSLVALVLASTAAGQAIPAELVGTWSSGSKAVVTGSVSVALYTIFFH